MKRGLDNPSDPDPEPPRVKRRFPTLSRSRSTKKVPVLTLSQVDEKVQSGGVDGPTVPFPPPLPLPSEDFEVPATQFDGYPVEISLPRVNRENVYICSSPDPDPITPTPVERVDDEYFNNTIQDLPSSLTPAGQLPSNDSDESLDLEDSDDDDDDDEEEDLPSSLPPAGQSPPRVTTPPGQVPETSPAPPPPSFFGSVSQLFLSDPDSDPGSFLDPDDLPRTRKYYPVDDDDDDVCPYPPDFQYSNLPNSSCLDEFSSSPPTTCYYFLRGLGFYISKANFLLAEKWYQNRNNNK